eukprot:CAMPEP_0202366188 /NCGR_PEP_ID=MMETSP1126-20121109/16898_1 /ASSEMBLY_ACC=CAM_ASM_000457 /TAXON_ID=3047 /ORGANISM="Dunaliella tertiolecta, Strain CCMP1320" /LENGTH=226 /DNA_ID=CAMNT_0048961185 /DNA_START=1 /DNA_END=681 /DNA_ORIENTATION=-
MRGNQEGNSARKKALITGGAGYVGHRLGQKLAEEGQYQAVLFDIRPPAEQVPGVQVVTGDVRDEDAVQAACQGCDVVFHVASFGMTGDEALDRQRVHQVNVQGTQNVLRACQAQGVGRLVYVSSYNAVFDGSHPIHGADEQSARVIDYTHTSCPYTATKAQAEQMVLAADCTHVQDANASPPRSEGAPYVRDPTSRNLWARGAEAHHAHPALEKAWDCALHIWRPW